MFIDISGDPVAGPSTDSNSSIRSPQCATLVSDPNLSNEVAALSDMQCPSEAANGNLAVPQLDIGQLIDPEPFDYNFSDLDFLKLLD